MNYLIFNYPASVWNVVDWRTADFIIDFGFRIRQEKRAQLAHTLQTTNAESERRAQHCLRTLLIRGPDADPRTHGREVIVSPLRPDHYSRARLSVYVPLRRPNTVFGALTVNYAGWDFIDVNSAMRLLAETQYDPSEAARIVSTSDIAPVPMEAVGRRAPPQQRELV